MKKRSLIILLALPVVGNAHSKVDVIKAAEDGACIQKTGEYISFNGIRFKKGRLYYD